LSKKKKSEKPSKNKSKEKKPKPVKVETKEKKPKSAKVVRDSFTMPKNDYAKLKELKSKYLAHGVHIKKGELLRAGLYALEQMDEKQLLGILDYVEPVKTGRPKEKADL